MRGTRGAALAAVWALALTACAPLPEQAPSTAAPTTSFPTSSSVASSSAKPSKSFEKYSPAPSPAQSAAADLEPQLQELADRVASTYGGSAAVAVSSGEETASSGEEYVPVAWSTIKVPIAVAALNADATLAPLAEAAITVSDNGAAETLWLNIAPADAEAVLAAAGTPLAVNPVVTRPGFTAFGQTPWSTGDQATFAAGLPCVAGAAPVLDMMSRVAPDQSWGFGQLPGAQFKGGWGPNEAGGYTVRQFALIDGHGLALTASPADGSYATAQLMANELAAGLAPLAAELPQSRCM
ncbi:hypothetical protein [Corynebacterium sp. Marseille-P4321]|uniref:hypothetical protein n=1 Tax=Corynebacterium sp. Marseille-P4321 TaxID=2736603 RepID=UPI0020CA71C4|nr:hypothetical protein [Corynebacterium sp. Marseille-P4321]